MSRRHGKELKEKLETTLDELGKDCCNLQECKLQQSKLISL